MYSLKWFDVWCFLKHSASNFHLKFWAKIIKVKIVHEILKQEPAASHTNKCPECFQWFTIHKHQPNCFQYWRKKKSIERYLEPIWVLTLVKETKKQKLATQIETSAFSFSTNLISSLDPFWTEVRFAHKIKERNFRNNNRRNSTHVSSFRDRHQIAIG